MPSEHERLRSLRHARIRRIKQVLRYLPRRSNIDRYPVLKWFARHARGIAYLWSFRVPHASPAFYAGSIIAFLPLYGIQLALAVGAAILFRANLPILCGLQLLTNPVTALIIYPVNFFVGKRVIAMVTFGADIGNWDNWFNALIAGGFVVGLAFGAMLDIIYRVAAWQAAAQYEKIKAHKEAASGQTPKTPSKSRKK